MKRAMRRAQSCAGRASASATRRQRIKRRRGGSLSAARRGSARGVTCGKRPSTSVPSHARDRLDELMRCRTHPASSHDRLQLLDDGRVQLALKTPRFDRTSRLILTADEIIGRLVAIIPRPHKNLILYNGVLAPNSKLRARHAARRVRLGGAPAAARARPRQDSRPRGARAHGVTARARVNRAHDSTRPGLPACSTGRSPPSLANSPVE